MGFVPGPRVDACIATLPAWQQAVCVRVAVYEHGELDAAALQAMFRRIIANNRAGGRRELKARGAG